MPLVPAGAGCTGVAVAMARERAMAAAAHSLAATATVPLVPAGAGCVGAAAAGSAPHAQGHTAPPGERAPQGAPPPLPARKYTQLFKEGVNLTKSLIAQSNLFASVEKEVPESISQTLTSLLVLRLDRKRISFIPNLQGLEQIRSIHLQSNQIGKNENLSCFPNLKFLPLAGNRISRVENLRTLPKLQLLDLSHNHIESLNTDVLPQSLLVLELTGNKCTKQNSYRESVLAALPHLIEPDAQHVPRTSIQCIVDDSGLKVTVKHLLVTRKEPAESTA
ncbi:LOW QUALITY PROTEIN: leucine-rich repeat-containing protein 46-like [Eublepharis macularius]|uniref:LOW QUALITY PROTEIN: leucine-rich repeat-containing protein 46-like n=1 Tax=Eublepharis macularius TaxID=481883 RepID=A0AA97J2U0_EUBMA|nr:LOW QUALITY PROTEIN: leucine-rich repeat-containing protein 46-like [Eublepharis macularius]